MERSKTPSLRMNILPVRASARKQSMGCAKRSSFLAFVTATRCPADLPFRSFSRARVVRPRLVRRSRALDRSDERLLLFTFINNFAADHGHGAGCLQNIGLGNFHDVFREDG